MTNTTTINIPAGDEIMRIDNVGFAYGDVQIIRDLDVSVKSGEFMCIVGPSGAGKTTLLNCLAGLRLPTSGQIVFNGDKVTGPPRALSVVFQDYSRSLMPWLSARDNVALPLRSAGVPKKERITRANDALTEVGLAEHGDKYPWEMSGGMQQRVAIARALAYQPSVIIMDEPFASVDAQTRADLEDLTLRVRERLGITLLLVTHDIDEAVYLSDRVMVLGGGRPATMVDLINVDLGTHRDQITTKELPEFANIRSRIYREIRRPTTPDTAAAANDTEAPAGQRAG